MIVAMLLECFVLLIGTLRATMQRHRALVVENLLLRHQLMVLARSGQSVKFRLSDKLLWLAVRRVVRDWSRHLVLVQPATVVRWHRRGWKLFWHWKSRAPLGRPRLSQEVRDLISAMSRDNGLWGTERIRGELLSLGIIVSNRSIRRYRWREPARAPSQTWRTFLTNHRPQIWATDLLTVHTLTFRTLYVLFFIAHDRRTLLHFNVTSHPTAAWVWRQLVEATAWGRRPRYLIRDRDRVFGGDFAARAKGFGIETLLSPVRAPRANAIAERMVRTFRNDCLDHLIVMNEQHLVALLKEYTDYYNTHRPHRSLDLQAPVPDQLPRAGPIRARSILGGLHHAYERAA